jgi:hypothetical protein
MSKRSSEVNMDRNEKIWAVTLPDDGPTGGFFLRWQAASNVKKIYLSLVIFYNRSTRRGLI